MCPLCINKTLRQRPLRQMPLRQRGLCARGLYARGRGRPGAPETPGGDYGAGFTDFLAESDGRVVKNEGLGILPRILRI